MKVCHVTRVVRTLFIVSVTVALVLLLTTLHQGRRQSPRSVKKDIRHMPEIAQLDRYLGDQVMPPEGEGAVWKHAPHFVPLAQIQKSHLGGGDGRIPQSYKGSDKLPAQGMRQIPHNNDNAGTVITNRPSGAKSSQTKNNNDSLKPSQNNGKLKDTKLTFQSRKDNSAYLQNGAKNVDMIGNNKNVSQINGGYRTETKIDKEGFVNKTVITVTDTPKRIRHKQQVSASSTPCHQSAPLLGTFYTQSDIFCLTEDTTKYVQSLGGARCLVEGSDVMKTKRKSNGECVCLPGWHGQECSMPDVVYKSEYPYHYGVVIRETPRRVIYAMPVNHEFDLVEAKVNELGSVVDVFVLLECNITAAGQPKRTLLLEKLRQGFLKEFHKKIVYLQLTYFPREARADGWVMDSLLRNYIGDVALNKVLRDVRLDDVMIMHDADEIPIRETLLFLKLHDGYPEPFGFKMKHRVLGFFWRPEQDMGNIYGGATINFIRHMLGNQTYFLRNPSKITNSNTALVGRYKRKHRGRVHAWSFGNAEIPAGWHCSWCFNAQGVQYKMLSAHVSDTPRWGTMKNLTQLPYIKELIQTGHWFDNRTTYTQTNYTVDKDLYAPSYLLKNWNKFSHLLDKNAALLHRSDESNLLRFYNKIR